ncbi:MAG: carbon-nitrogen hydrolase family protein [Sedimentibacter sp.]|uniref:carbon-nitrogen hydrolase family protein n=1 Tax=Sedimentibacter sp. TaxID=1960295 RepID=UPI0031594E9A
MKKFTAAVIQYDSRNDKGENLKNFCKLIDEAALKGAKLVAMAEYFNLIGDNIGEGGAEEEIPGLTIDLMREKAIEHNMWILCGSIAEKNHDGKPYNTSVLLSNKGEIVCKYSKLHMFDVELNSGISAKESDTKQAGNRIVTAETELGHFGFSICYDMRFPELYRIMALKGAQVIFVPANFTMPTGKDHWEPLLRARAIENSCYIIAPGQIGKKTRFDAYGKSLIIDPWGNIIAKASDKNCVITAEIDYDYLQSIRDQIPSLKNRRTDVYEIKEKI